MPRGIYPRRVKRHAGQPQDPSYRLIALTQNQVAIVDVADFEWLNQFNWYASWCEHIKGFYAMRSLPDYGTTVTMQAFILNCQPGEQGDHKNHNTLDNRRENLRKCTPSQNQANSPNRVRSKSGYRGVQWEERGHKWVARIRFDGKYMHLGSFSRLQDAVYAYDEAAKKYHGEFASLNFPNEC